jgi:hypothetical protein
VKRFVPGSYVCMNKQEDQRNRSEAGRKAVDKKIGAESSDPNRHSQPRLPGSVVGEASMRHTRIPHKITEVSVLK